ncbi:MAG TPA: lysophospholipid acyltransferase family protein [Solirubrobacteraceae bacterium]|nr:lysophospholipid acyltransferase family protein [Solirubrobacteraceae bacterium]
MAAPAPPVPPKLPPPPRVEGVGRRTRLRTDQRVHALVPARLDLALHRRRARRRADLAAAEAAMEDVVGATPRAGEIPELARRYVDARAEREALLWRPSIFRPPHLAGEEHARAAESAPGGVVIVFGHLSSYVSVFAAVRAVLGPAYAVGSARHFLAADRGADALVIQRTRAVIVGLGHPFIPAPGSMEVLETALRAGRAVAIAFDVPGRTPVDLLGRRRFVAAGPSRLAARTDSTILPVITRNDGPRVEAEFRPPLRAQPGEEPAALEQRVADAFAPFVLDRPWSIQDPHDRWALDIG